MKDVVKQALDEATIYEREESQKEEKNLFENLEKYAQETGKLTIYTLDDAQKEQWKEVMQAIYPKFYDLISKDLIEQTIQTQ